MDRLAKAFLVIALFASCSGSRDIVHGLPGSVVGKEMPLVPEKVWAVSGYLHENPGKRVYVAIRENRILSITQERPRLPEGNVIETESTIFPGFVDMQGRGKYAILPLWPKAQSQFLNRHEWRGQFPPFREMMARQMRGVAGDAECAAARWAEVKAAVGGATAIQGLGAQLKCGEGFGVANLEIPADMGDVPYKSMSELLFPDLLGVFAKEIEPEMDKGATYEASYQNYLQRQKVTAWVDLFVREPHTIGNALKLLIGNGFQFSGTQLLEKDFTSAEPQIRRYLSGAPYRKSEAAIQKQMEAMRRWIFGDGSGPSYLKSKKDIDAAYDFLSKEGILTLPLSAQRYVGKFEHKVRLPVLDYYQQRGPKALVALLGEGKKTDLYTKQEFAYAKKIGLLDRGLVIAQGVGLSSSNLQDAANLELSLVWSPLSNLLLYGETLDVAQAKAMGLNLTLGTDWALSGSKNLLDELKIARRYLDQNKISSIRNKDLVEMVTVNAAKALQKENEMGAVRPGFLANLTLLDCPVAQDVYDCVLKSEQKDITLVVVNGHGLYGDTKPIQTLAKLFADNQEPEPLPRRTPTSVPCAFRKAIRFQPPADYDRVLQRTSLNFRSVEQLQTTLESAMSSLDPKGYRGSPDLLFTCEDKSYSARVGSVIEKEVPLNRKNRASIRRAEFNLLDSWSPLLPQKANKDLSQ